MPRPASPRRAACTHDQRRIRSRSCPSSSARRSSRRSITRRSSIGLRSRTSEATSKAGSPTSGFGSIATQPSPCRSTFPPCRSWCRSTCGVGSARSSSTAGRTSGKSSAHSRAASASGRNGCSGRRLAPEAAEHARHGAGRLVLVHRPRARAGDEPLEQQRPALAVVLEDADGAVAVPAREGVGLVLRLRRSSGSASLRTTGVPSSRRAANTDAPVSPWSRPVERAAPTAGSAAASRTSVTARGGARRRTPRCGGGAAASAGTRAASDGGTAATRRRGSASTSRPDASTTASFSSALTAHTEYTRVPPGRTRAAAARTSASWSSGSGSARQRRSGRPASTPIPEHGASTSARSKPTSSSGSAEPVRLHDRDPVARRAARRSPAARSRGPDGARPRRPRPRASSPCRPAPRRGRACARRPARRPRGRRAARPRSAARSGPRRAPSRPRAGRGTRRARPDPARPAPRRGRGGRRSGAARSAPA